MKNKKEKISIIEANNRWLNINLYELISYLDLIVLFVKRDFAVFYKQTILGPLWYIIQPLVNTIVFTVIFGNLAKIPTDGHTPFIFYFCGTIIWSYFALCVNSTSSTFVSNASVFGKVYFPRLTVPIATVIISLVQFLIQFLLLLIILIYFYFIGSELLININYIYIPLIIIHVSIISLGFGILISALTTKYRDLTFVLSFGLQLWMYATPIVYSFNLIPEKYKILMLLNPMTVPVENFKAVIFGSNNLSLFDNLIGITITFIIFFMGLIFFNKVEKTFMDTV